MKSLLLALICSIASAAANASVHETYVDLFALSSVTIQSNNGIEDVKVNGKTLKQADYRIGGTENLPIKIADKNGTVLLEIPSEAKVRAAAMQIPERSVPGDSEVIATYGENITINGRKVNKLIRIFSGSD